MIRQSAAVFALALLACNGEEPVPDEPTWDEVGPIIERSCTGCHIDGGAAPFPLTEYADASDRAAQIAVAVENRTMPPWLVRDDGTCGEFADSIALSADEIETVTAWANGSRLEGKGASLQPAPLPALESVEIALKTPDFVPEPEGTLFAEDDEYRCFVFDNPLDADGYITASEAIPGNEAIVHHVLAMPVDPGAPSWAGSTTNAEEIAAMDGADGRAGWDCLGTAGGNIRERGIPVTWAPGQGAVTYPDGVGVWIGAHEKLIVQVHYNFPDPALIGGSDSTTVQLQVADQVEKPATVVLLDPFIESVYGGSMATLDPGQSAVDYGWVMDGYEVLSRADLSSAEADGALTLYGVMPHMHKRGTSLTFKIGADNDRVKQGECAADVPAWDFEWQRLYFYSEPLEVPLDQAFKVNCTYDTSGDSSPILPGWGTDYEMCLLAAVVGL